MSPEEIRQLLGEVAAIDNRRLSPETVNIWHSLLHGFTLPECRDALATHRRNAPDVWLMPGHLVAIIRRKTAFANRTPTCPHGVRVGDWCHDCAHPTGCPACTPIPGLSDTPENRRAAVASMSAEIRRRTA